MWNGYIRNTINHGGGGKEMQGMTDKQFNNVIDLIIAIIKKSTTRGEVLEILEALKKK